MTNVDLPNLAAKICFIALKAEVDKLDIEETVNVPSYLNNLKTIVVGLDVDKVETLPIDFKKASNVVNRKVVKKTKYNKLISKVHDLEDKIYDASTLIHEINITWINKVWRKIQKVNNCLFGATKKYIYIGHGVAFDGADSWKFGNQECRNVVIFGVGQVSN